MQVLINADVELWEGHEVDAQELGDTVHQAIEETVVGGYPVKSIGVRMEFRD